MKAILNINTVNKYINLHKVLKIPFTIAISNYTTRIKSDAYDLHFMKTEQSNQTFAAAAKVKKDCMLQPLPDVNLSRLKYYDHLFLNKKTYQKTIYNFDLKSAYAQILLNDNFISQETFNYLKKIPKMKRLAAVGMMAGQKNLYTINEEGETVNREKITSPNANYFFYCVKRMSEIISGAAEILGDGFLFSWVDGIYFQDGANAKENAKIIIEEYFNKINFPVTFEILTEFKVKEENKYFEAYYKKEGKTKYIIVPKKEHIMVEKITSFLLHQ